MHVVNTLLIPQESEGILTPTNQAVSLKQAIQAYKQKGKIYNIGGGRYSNCSILEALDFVEREKKIRIKRKYLPENRIGDHIWNISDNSRFKRDYPGWKQRYNINKIMLELIDNY